MIDPLHALLSPEEQRKEEEAEASISDAFNAFAQDTAEKIVGASAEYAGPDGKLQVQIAMTIAESILIGVFNRLPIAPGNEAKIMQAMKVNVKRRLEQWRQLKGPAQGRG